MQSWVLDGTYGHGRVALTEAGGTGQRMRQVTLRIRDRSRVTIDDQLRKALHAAQSGLALSRNQPNVRAGVILAAFDVNRTRAVLDALSGNPTLSMCPIVVVANSASVENAHLGTLPQSTIRGSNSSHEYSAYDEGLAELTQLMGGSPDVIVVCNDRACSYRDGFLEIVDWKLLRLSMDEALALGNLDDPGRPLNTSHGILRRYLRGNCLVAPIGFLPSFRFVTFFPEEFDEVIPGSINEASTGEAAMAANAANAEHASFIWRWLTTDWYRGGAVTPSNWPILREKARDILNEHALTLRLMERGVGVAYADRAFAIAGMRLGRRRSRLLRDLREPRPPSA